MGLGGWEPQAVRAWAVTSAGRLWGGRPLSPAFHSTGHLLDAFTILATVDLLSCPGNRMYFIQLHIKIKVLLKRPILNFDPLELGRGLEEWLRTCHVTMCPLSFFSLYCTPPKGLLVVKLMLS